MAPTFPFFVSPFGDFVFENVPAGRPVYRAFAIDPSAVQYALAAGVGDDDLFKIDPATGQVSFKQSPDFEYPLDFDHDNIYQLDIVATDAAGRSATRGVHIRVGNLPELHNQFTTGFTATVPDDVSTTTPVYTAHAIRGFFYAPRAQIHYTLAPNVGDNNLFNIDAVTGAVTFKTSPEYLAHGDVYDIVITASNGLHRFDGTRDVAITITNVAPSAPVDANPAPNVVAESAQAGTPVGLTASSTDADGAAVTYSLAGDTSGGGFAINPRTGIVTVADPAKIDYVPSGGSFQVTVQATDPGEPSARQSFDIAVDAGSTFSYGPAPVVAKGHSASEAPSVSSPEAVDHFAFASGASATGGYGTAAVNATSGVVTYAASSAPAAGTTATESFAVVDTDKYGVQTTATAVFKADGGSAVTYATESVPPGRSVTDTPTVKSPGGGDTFAFISASGAGTTEIAGSFGTATINPGTGAITYSASPGASGTTTFTVSDTDHAGATTTTTASFDDTDTWIGAAGGDWQTGSHWSFGAPPEAESALIPSGATPEILSAVMLDAVTASNAGTIAVAADQTLTLVDGTSVTGGTLTIVAAGADGGAIDIEGPTGATLNGIVLEGNGGEIEVGMTAAATLTLESGTTITGAFVTVGAFSGSTLDIEAASGAGSSGATLDGDVVTNGGSITIGSAATFDGDTISNNGTIAIRSPATLTLDDDTTITGGTLTVDAGGTLGIEKGGGTGVSGAELDSVAVTNSGTIAVAAAATLTLNNATLDSTAGSLDNAGTIEIQGSSKLELASSVKGTGTIVIGSGAALEVTAQESQTVVFAAVMGTLQIDQPALFTADISAAKGRVLESGDIFDFSSLDYLTTTATTGNGSYDTQSNTTTLTVIDTNISKAFTFTLLGNYSGSTFTVTNDGHGGADVADPPAGSAASDRGIAIARGEHDTFFTPDHAFAFSPHHGPADADHFVFDTMPLPHVASHRGIAVADHTVAHDGVLDVSAIVAALHASEVPTQALFEAVENSAVTVAALEVNKGTAAAPHWVAIAHLAGLHPGDAVALAYDAADPADVVHIQVEAHALTGHLG